MMPSAFLPAARESARREAGQCQQGYWMPISSGLEVMYGQLLLEKEGDKLH